MQFYWLQGQNMARLRIVLGILLFILGHFGSVSTQSPNVCKTFGSGVIQTFNNTMLHVKSTCPLILTHFSHAGVDCYISVQRDPTGLIKRVEILVNKIVTTIQDGTLTVEGNSISLPNDNTYQSVYKFGIYTRLTSKVLPLSVTWYSLPDGVTSLWVQLDRPLVDGMTGMCGGLSSSETRAQLLESNVIRNELCVTEDSQPVDDKTCKDFKSEARECLGRKLYIFDQLCKLNMYINVHGAVKCSFFEEFLHPCNGSNPSRSRLRNITSCGEPPCPGDLKFKDQGAAFPPTCSNPQLQTEFQTSTCLPQDGLVLNDRAEAYHSVKVEDCPCVRGGRTYHSGQRLSSKCQTCDCIKGKWICSANTCPTPCVIEGWFVTTFDGKQYSLPGKCTYVAARGLNWTVTIILSDVTIQELYLDVYQERYTFSLNSVQLWEKEISITDLSQTEHVTVYWQSSMFVTVQTTLGIKMQVQVSPEVQMYLYLPQSVTSAGLCGSKNNNTEDDFTTSSGIVENSAQPFALSWTLGDCTPNNPPVCINTDNELFAEDKCSQLTNASGVFAQCHDYVPVNTYFEACIQRTCHATSDLQERACVGLGNYAKACTSQGINVGDWRGETACPNPCESNLMFDYAMQACNRTCRSLSGPDPTCDMADEPVEGCGCPSGTHLNTPLRCSPRALCNCNYPGGIIPPGSTVIDGLQCMCEYGNLTCSEACDCPHGQICVHCARAPVNTAQTTCESLSKTFIDYEICISGCYCPEGQFADHNGNCVTRENCTCEFSGVVYATGQSVESNCKTCTCSGGQWNCEGDPCPGVCEVFGNGQYKTFDSKWYRFGGHCQYTLVEAIDGLFSIQAESVPCCDEVLTCSRSITVKLMDEVSLILRDMNVTQKVLPGWSFRAMSLYSVHTVGLYFIISVPKIGLTVIWDKQTRVKIELQASWNGKVRGLCGDFDGKLMNDLQTSSSTVVSSTLEFGNSWKTAVPPCSDVTQELFPCERHSYCAAWAQRRCMILHSDTFKDCHLKVDPASYYQACILESCSCDFEGKFLGFCTAVAAYADACSAHNACIKWRTPDLCPVYCDYYNEEGQSSWHYEACPQQIKTCGKNNKFSGELEGCYPRCPAEMPYYDENRRICSSLDNCTCYFNNTVVEPGSRVNTDNEYCDCIGGKMICAFISMNTSTSTKPPTTTNTHVTTLTTTGYTTMTDLVIRTGPTFTPSPTGSQISGDITTIKTTTKHIPTTPKITTVHEATTAIPTKTPITTITTTPVITTKESASTTISTTTAGTPVTTKTSTTAISTEESTTSLTTTTETPVTIETSTPEISTGEPTTTTLLTSTEASVSTSTTQITVFSNITTSLTTTSTETPIITTTTPEITTKESASTTSLTTTETTVTTLTPKITTVPTTSMSIITNLTETPAITTTTTPEITTEESASTTSLTTTTETPVTTSTPEITTVPTTSMSLNTTSTETSGITTTTTPEIPTEESASTTLLTTAETPVTTSTPEITTVPKTSMSLTTNLTETPAITTTTTPEITTEESAFTTSLTTTTETPVTTSTPEITTVPTTSMSLTTTSTETSVITTTTTPEIPTEESASTTSLTTTTETPVTTSTPEITTIHTTLMSLTTTSAETPIITTTTPEITTEESASTTLLPTTTETPVTTSTLEITTVPKTSMSLTTTSTETPVITTTKTPEIPTEESASTTSLTTTTETPVTTSTPKITTIHTTLMSLTTTSAETPVITTTTSEITTEESASTTSLTTTTETPVTTSTLEITTVPKTSMSLTTTSTETPVITTTTTPEITTEESASTTSLTTTTETPVTTSTPKITTIHTTLMSLTTTSAETPVITTTTSEITTKESASTTSLTTTTETPVTTSTLEITTVPKTSMSLTTTSTETPVITTTTTPEITTEESASTTSLTTTTETPVTTSTPKITTIHTTLMSLTTTSAETPVITTTTPEITTEESASTTSLPTTTETPVTTSTPEITTVPKTSMSLTTTSTETPVITTTTTPEITTEESASTTSLTTTTETLVTTSTPKITTIHTTLMSLTTTSAETPASIMSTTFVLECKDLIRNQSWPDGYQWTEDCFNKTCTNGVIVLRPLICPTPVVPVCPRGMPQLVKDEQGCCDTWQCDCQCDVFGDPHYTSFAGKNFMFLENCTYVLVEERMPLHHLSISVDNYYCEESASCAKGIVLKYRNNTVVLQAVQVSDETPILKITLNEVKIQSSYEADGFRFVSTNAEVYVYIEEIRSSIFLSVWNTLQINLAMEHFLNNTQGQCGVCGGASCIRRNGSVESDDCCAKTAYEWIEDDPLKPYCAQAPRHVPCIPEITPTPTILPNDTAPCDLLTNKVFSECSLDFDVETLVRNCIFDYSVAQNNATVCSPLERLADHCKKMGICVAWRKLTSGICDIPCPEGMIFDECRSTPTDFCSGGLRVPGTVLDSMRSGCFCPDNQLLAESHKMICVSECTNCKGPLGEPMLAGAIWESNCHICTCNNQTLTEECWPKPSAPTPTCGSGFTIISDCCNNQICVEKTCEYNEKIYKVGETWRDAKSPCVTFRCTTEGTEIEKTVCPQQFCPEELRVWDEHHCCYSCNTTCGVRLSRMTVENCTQEVILPTCEGNCASESLWVRSGKDLQLEHNQFCCRERKYELRQISLVCSGETPIQYTYKHITGCECQLEV